MKALLKRKMNAINSKMAAVLTKMKDNSGEWYTDNAVKVAIVVVLGALLIGALIVIFGDANSGLLGMIKDRIESIFNF